MNSRVLKLLLVPALCAATAFAAGDDAFKAPDSLVLKDGRTVRGLIVKNSVDSVLLQEEFGENLYPKKDILRIRDEADINILFTDISRKADLPSWRVIANDLRMIDRIRSVVAIPATAIDNGEFRNVPYISFRVNEMVELNIYGDPNDPAGLELGIYGRHSGDDKLRKRLRSYLAGFLTTREEIAALYSLDLKGGSKKAGDITVEITPKSAPDAYGAWWISLYSMKDLDAVRLSDKAYAKLARPPSEVVGKNGEVIASGWTKKDLEQAERLDHMKGSKKQGVLLRGFYRDANGDFQLLKAKGS